MCDRQVQFCLLALLLSSLTTATAVGAPTTRDVRGSQLLVKEYLDNLDVPHGRIRQLTHEFLAHDFPDYLFFVVVYPSAAQLPEPLKTANVFAVGPDGRVRLLSGSPAIVELFTVGFRPEKAEGRCREAVRVTLLLLGARHPEYQFTPPTEIKIQEDTAGRKRGVGKLEVKEGGTGFIEATLTLDRNCDPIEVVETVTLKPARLGLALPTSVQIETAEKLVKGNLVALKLSTDPVRYLNDPVLVRAFPGYLLFVVPGSDPERNLSGKLDIMIVGPEGKPERLFGPGAQFLSLFNTAFGPTTDDPHIKERLSLAVRLTQIINPQFKFGPPGDPQITTDDQGGRTVSSKTAATGPGGKPLVLEIRLHFGKRGRLASWGYRFRPEKT